MGLSKELVKVFIFFGTEDYEAADAFLFFMVACSVALVFFASDAEGRTGHGVGAGGAEKIGSFSLGATDSFSLALLVSSGVAANASAGLACSSGTTLEVALAIS